MGPVIESLLRKAGLIGQQTGFAETFYNKSALPPTATRRRPMDSDPDSHNTDPDVQLPPSPLCPTFSHTLAQARSGDKDAQEELFRCFYVRVEMMVHRSLARDMRAKRPWLASRFSTGDVVQDVFRSLLSDLDGFAGRTESDFVGYLAMIVRNRLVDALRFHEASQRDGRRTSGLPDAGDYRKPGPGPATQAASRDELEFFNRVIGTFPQREQLLLRARLERQLEFQELADLLGYSSRFVARRAFFSAQAQLAIRMRQHGTS